MTDESKSLKIVRNVAVGEGAIALHKLLAEYQPDIVNRHLGLLMSTIRIGRFVRQIQSLQSTSWI